MTGAAAFLSFLLSLAVLLATWQFGIRPAIIDWFRFRMGDISSTLEELESDPDVETDSPEFDLLQSFTTGTAEHVDHLNVLTLMVGWAAHGFSTAPQSEEVAARMENLLRGEMGTELREVTHRLLIEVALFFLLLSPSLWIPFGLLLLVQSLRKLATLSPTIPSPLWSVSDNVVEGAFRHPGIASTIFSLPRRIPHAR